MNFKKDKYYICLGGITYNNVNIFIKGKKYLCIANNILLGENYFEFCFDGDREQL